VRAAISSVGGCTTISAGIGSHAPNFFGVAPPQNGPWGRGRSTNASQIMAHAWGASFVQRAYFYHRYSGMA